MKKYPFALFFVALLFATTSCTLPTMIKMAKEQELNVEPNPLEVHNDIVTYTVSAKLPVKMLKKGTLYTLRTHYKYGTEKELGLDPISFRLEDFPKSNTEEIRVSKTFSFPYLPEYRQGVLEMDGEASKGDNMKTTPRKQVAVGIITTSKLAQKSYYAAYADYDYNNNEEVEPINIPNFTFEQGKAKLRKSELRSNRGKQFDAFIASKNVAKTVLITGTHSPEGSEEANQRLSGERATAIEKYYRNQMNKYDYKNMASSIKFVLKPLVEDWSPFKTALASYQGISKSQKNTILEIINNGKSFVEQAKSLEKLPFYKKMFRNLYPGLRRSSTQVMVLKKKKTDAEIMSLAHKISNGDNKDTVDNLSIEELMYAATLTPDLSEKEKIYMSVTKMASNWKAHNNLGATYISMAIQENPKENMEKAIAQLEIAQKMSEGHPKIDANMATLYLMQNDTKKTIEYAKKALRNASKKDVGGINGVKGAAELRIAQYADASSSTAAATPTIENLFNKGLAELLNKNAERAAISFDEAIKKDDNYALAYYGAAIVAARLNKTEDVITYLSQTIAKDRTLKNHIMTDLEFAKLAENTSFKNIFR